MALLDLTNLIKSETCFTRSHKSLINLFLTNNPLSLQKNANKTSSSDYQKLISIFLNLILQG